MDNPMKHEGCYRCEEAYGKGKQEYEFPVAEVCMAPLQNLFHQRGELLWCVLHRGDCLFADDLNLAVIGQFDDTGGGVGMMLLSACKAYIVYTRYDLRGYIAEIGRCGLPADIGAGADEGFLKTIAQLFGKGLVGDAEGYRAIFAQQVRCQVNSLVATSSKSHATLGTFLT